MGLLKVFTAVIVPLQFCSIPCCIHQAAETIQYCIPLLHLTWTWPCVVLCRSPLSSVRQISMRCPSLSLTPDSLMSNCKWSSSFCFCVGPMTNIDDAKICFDQLSEQVIVFPDLKIRPVLTHTNEEWPMAFEGIETIRYAYILVYRLGNPEHFDQWNPLDPILADALLRILWLIDDFPDPNATSGTYGRLLWVLWGILLIVCHAQDAPWPSSNSSAWAAV